MSVKKPGRARFNVAKPRAIPVSTGPGRIFEGGVSMRRLVTVEQLIEDAKVEGLDPDQIFVDPDDVVELPEEPEED